jgi:hypothetical protein
MRSPRRLLVLAVASPLFLSGCFLHVRLPDMPAGRQSDYGLRMEAHAPAVPSATRPAVAEPRPDPVVAAGRGGVSAGPAGSAMGKAAGTGAVARPAGAGCTGAAPSGAAKAVSARALLSRLMLSRLMPSQRAAECWWC